MTADGSPSLPQRDELREEVALALASHSWRAWECSCDTHGETVAPAGDASIEDCHLADVVLNLLAARRDDLAERVARVEALARRAREATRDTENPGAATVWLVSLEEALNPRAALTSDRAATKGGGERG